MVLEKEAKLRLPTGIMHQRWERKTTSLKLACLTICTMQDSNRANEPHPCSDLCSLRKHGAAYNNKGGSSPFQSRLHVKERAIQRASLPFQPPTGKLGLPHIPLPYLPGQLNCYHHRLSWIGFMSTNTLYGQLTSLILGHLDRFISLHLTLQRNQFATIIGVYALTLMADPTTKEAF